MGKSGGWGSSLEPVEPANRSREVTMAYPQFDDFVDKERALLLWGGGSSAASGVIEQRKHRRVAWRAQMTANELPNDSVFPKFRVSGEVLNIGAGGVCILSDVP